MRTSALQYLYLQKPVTSVIIVCAIALLPWLNSDFYTKGEPREASVAVSMIETGNWMLPSVYAGEFAYKPPMTHWLIALCSLPGGHVSEFAARLPSALAQIVLIGCVLAFFGKRIRFQEAFIATLLLLTCFEIHRAGMTARVDMLLTTFIVLGLMQLYRWENRLELKGLPVIIPLLFSGATLTKGPVGIILPLFIFFVYLLLLGKYSFGRIVKSTVYIGLSSAFIPMLWYVAAYREAGEAFLNVALAENFGRFFHLSEGNIPYDLGHEEGVFYNFITLLAGFVPWTLLAVFSFFGIPFRRSRKSFGELWRDVRRWFLSMEKMKRFSLVAAACILFFYAFPSSKRSVYLMPAYPFISILLAQYIIYVTENRSKVTRIFAGVLTGVASLVFAAGLLLMTHAADVASIVPDALAGVAGAFSFDSATCLTAMSLLGVSIATVICQLTKRINLKILYATLLLTFSVNLFVDGVVMKSIKNDASSRPFAEYISGAYELDGRVFVMNNLREYRNLYGMNFYMKNSFRDFEKERPDEGYFLTTERDVLKALERYGAEYRFEQLAVSARQGDIRCKAMLFRFRRTALGGEGAGS